MVKQRVDELYDIISDAKNELDNIRENCSHCLYTVKLYQHRVGSIRHEKVCDECGAVVPGITEEEITTAGWSTGSSAAS